MSITPSYSHSNESLAKIKIGNSVYYLKDADLRSVVEAFGTATSKNSTNAVTSTGGALPTESAIYNFVISQMGSLASAITLLSESDHTAVANPEKGDFVIESDGKEWLYDGTAWREVGDESAYVPKTTTIAGLALSGNITNAALSSAMSLGALASKANATTTLNDYAKGINGASYTPGGTVTVILSQTATAATLTSSDYTPSGTVTVTPKTATFYQVASIGTLPSVNETTASFATAGVTAAIDGTDSEMLVLSSASTSNALTGTGFSAGTLPSLSTSATTIVTGISTASFTGTKATGALVTGVTYSKATLSSATFSGTSATITPTLSTGSKTITVS